jgi:hypothetical protein
MSITGIKVEALWRSCPDDPWRDVMRNPRRFRVALLVAGVAALCLLGQVAAVSPVQADDTPVSAGSPLPAGARAATLLMSEGFEGTWPSGLWATYDWDGTENGEYYWGADDFKPHGGAKSAWPARSGANGLDPASNDYPVNLVSWMVYGPFDLSAYRRQLRLLPLECDRRGRGPLVLGGVRQRD